MKRASATVYVLMHSYLSDGCDEMKLIGIYSSVESAEGACQRLRQQPGFDDHPNDFAIDAYELDMDHWTEGFVSDEAG